MPRVQAGYDPRAEALQTTAAPNIQTEQARFDPNASKAFQLAAALDKARPIIDQFNEKYERQKAQERILQEMKVDSYKEQFMRDNQDGAVSASQVGERFPETVPVVRARVAESIGSERGKQAVQGIIQEVLQNADLQTNTEARTAFLKQKRAELIGKIEPGNEFYSSGYISAVDKELNQYENQWLRQTAVYHKEVQSKDFSSKVVDALSASDPAKALEALDSQWKTSSSLSNIERNKLVVDTVTREAFGTDNPSLLDRIPTRFLNAETRADIQKTKLLIQEKRMTTVRDAEFLKGLQEKEQTRNDEIEMINKIVAGETVDPAQYKNRPESFQKALTIKDADRIPAAMSAANVQKVRSAILAGSTTAGLDQDRVIGDILANKNLNNADKKKLIEETPRLIEGVIAMQDDMVKSAFTARIGASLDALEKSPNQRIASIVSGTNLRSQAVSMFDYGIRAGFNAYYEENGKWPTGRAKQDIVDREIEKADKFIESRTRIGGGAEATPAAPAKVTPTPGTQAGRGATAAKPTPTQADIDFVKKNPAYKQQFINTFGREP